MNKLSPVLAFVSRLIIGFGMLLILSMAIPGEVTFANDDSLDSAEASISQVTVSQYEQNISGTKRITLDDLSEKISQEDSFILYIGYKGCPFCRAFSPVLGDFINKTSSVVYYLDLEDPTPVKLNSVGLAFLKDDVNLNGTPTVVLVQKGKVDSNHNYVGSDTTEQDLDSMI